METRTAAAEALTELILEVFRVNGNLLAAGDRLTAETGQTSSRWQVLGAIRDSAQPVAAIAREMGLARQSVQRTADLLAREGIVEYVDNPAHRRAKLVVLTATGRRTLDSISAGQVAWANELGRALGADARPIREATSVLRALRVQLETADGPRRAARAPRARTRVDHETGDGDGDRGADQPLRGSRRPGRR